CTRPRGTWLLARGNPRKAPTKAAEPTRQQKHNHTRAMARPGLSSKAAGIHVVTLACQPRGNKICRLPASAVGLPELSGSNPGLVERTARWNAPTKARPTQDPKKHQASQEADH